MDSKLLQQTRILEFERKIAKNSVLSNQDYWCYIKLTVPEGKSNKG